MLAHADAIATVGVRDIDAAREFYGNVLDLLEEESEQGYTAGPVKIPSHWLMFAGQFVPLLHLNDHPPEDAHALALRVSVPDAIASFVRQQAPQTKRVELCHANGRIVVRRGWEPLGASCEPGPGDDVIPMAP